MEIPILEELAILVLDEKRQVLSCPFCEGAGIYLKGIVVEGYKEIAKRHHALGRPCAPSIRPDIIIERLTRKHQPKYLTIPTYFISHSYEEILMCGLEKNDCAIYNQIIDENIGINSKDVLEVLLLKLDYHLGYTPLSEGIPFITFDSEITKTDIRKKLKGRKDVKVSDFDINKLDELKIINKTPLWFEMLDDIKTKGDYIKMALGIGRSIGPNLLGSAGILGNIDIRDLLTNLDFKEAEVYIIKEES